MKRALAKSSLALVVACTLWAGTAQAVEHNITLNGIVADGVFQPPFSSGGTTFEQWSLGLSGLDAMSPLLVELGDTFNVTILLDTAFTVPASVTLTAFGLGLGGSGFPDVDTETSDNLFDFYNGIDLVKFGGPSSSSTRGQLASSVIFFSPDNGAFTFDSVKTSFKVTTLSDPGTLDFAVLSYTLFSPAAVPEPATWAMMIIGFGGVGALMRRGRRDGGRIAFA